MALQPRRRALMQWPTYLFDRRASAIRPAPAGVALPAANGEAMPPATNEMLDALARLAASEPLRASPQLVAFLRFVVDTVIRGEANRIKAYTIAVEALGRAPDFDPDADSIVRVVAGRLRRALQSYYADAGLSDPVVIELPRGSYVPVFRRRAGAAEYDGTAETPHPADAGPARHAARSFLWIASAAIVVALIGSFALAGLWPSLWHGATTATPATTAPASSSAEARPAPVIFVQPFDAVGEAPNPALSAARLRSKLADALARFDGMNIVTDTGSAAGRTTPSEWSEYRLSSSVEYRNEGALVLDFRLVDASDGTLVWSRTFDVPAAGASRGTAADPVVREVVTAIAAPFGVVWARELSAHAGRDPRRACIIALIGYWRSFDPAQHRPVRQCLLRMVADDPNDPIAFLGLAIVHYREYLLDIAGPGEPPALDQALRDALHAITLKPDMARAYEMLCAIWFSRGDLTQAFAAADKAVALNPYDTNAIGEYGARLVAAGQLDRGVTMLRQAAALTVIRPVWFNFHLFLGAYLSGDRSDALRYASELDDRRSPFSMLAQALTGQMLGNRDQARQAIDGLIQLNPGWGTDPRHQLAKFFPVASVRDRLLHDLEAAGLPDAN